MVAMEMEWKSTKGSIWIPK